MKLFIDHLKPIRYVMAPRNAEPHDQETVGFSAQNIAEALDAIGLPRSLVVDESDPNRLGVTHEKLLPLLVRDMQKMAEAIRSK